MSIWPADPNGSLVPILETSIEAAKMRHPSASGGSPGVVLDVADRCDACAAAAMYRVAKWKTWTEGQGPGDLYKALDYCHHHWTKHMPSMADQGWKVIGTNPDLIDAMYGRG